MTAACTSSSQFDQANTQKISGWIRFDFGAKYAIERPGADIINLANADYWATPNGSIGLSEPRALVEYASDLSNRPARSIKKNPHSPLRSAILIHG